MKYTLGLDVGSSSIKASLVEVASGNCVASDFFPKQEMPILAQQRGWAEQDPAMWYDQVKLAIQAVLEQSQVSPQQLAAIGISYQMHGLVVVDEAYQPLRPAIIWCDSRAVPYGQAANDALGSDFTLSHLLNSPGNFTASKLKWIQENEPEIYRQIHKIMLPGDYIALRMTGIPATTISGLSEGIFWDFKQKAPSQELLDQLQISKELLSPLVPTFGEQGCLTAEAAAELGLVAGIPVTYRAGDQPNNALSLHVMKPGETAATGGTSGVVYGVLDQVNYDPKSRVNTFAHVNYALDQDRLGVLLCINGTGILNSWAKRELTGGSLSYEQMNEVAAQAPVGCEGLSIIPFGNGAERVLENQEPHASIHGINFNIHKQAHLLRAVQEGIVFAFAYGMEVMKEMGMNLSVIKAGHTNMFLSPLFRQTLATVTGVTIELYETDGSVGAAKGAALGAGLYQNSDEAFASLLKIKEVHPIEADREATLEAYARWKKHLH